MIRFISILVLIVTSFSVSANSVESVEVLKSLMPKVCHFSGVFNQSKQIKTLPVPLNSTGEFIYSCDLGLIWKTQKPIVESLVFTNQKLHFLVPEKLSIENLDGVQHDFLGNLLLGLMSGNTEFISKEFEIDVSEQKGETTQLTLQPKNKMIKRAIQSVTLEKESTANELQIVITDKNNQVTKIISSEKQQYAQSENITKDTDFSKQCMSLSADGCELLLNPVRISTSGQN